MNSKPTETPVEAQSGEDSLEKAGENTGATDNESLATRTDPSETAQTSIYSAKKIPPWVKRAILLWWAILIGLWLLLGISRQLDSLLTQLVLSLFFSFAMEPAVDRLAARGINRSVATGITMVSVLAFFAAFIAAMGSLIAQELEALSNDLPQYVIDAELWAENKFNVDIENADLIDQVRVGGQANQIITDLAERLLGATGLFLGAVFQLLTILMFSFYLTAEGPKARRALCSILPPARQHEILRIWELAISKTGAFLVSRLILGLISGLFHWVVFGALSLPSALALGLWVGLISQFIPVVGIFIAGIVPTLIAVGSNPTDALWVLAAITAYQQVENYVIQPRVTAQTLNMHPAVAFGAVLAGTSMFGFTGAILALPALATGQAFISAYIARHDVVSSRLVGNGASQISESQSH